MSVRHHDAMKDNGKTKARHRIPILPTSTYHHLSNSCALVPRISSNKVRSDNHTVASEKRLIGDISGSGVAGNKSHLWLVLRLWLEKFLFRCSSSKVDVDTFFSPVSSTSFGHCHHTLALPPLILKRDSLQLLLHL